MKGDHMGTDLANPSPQELSLSTWTRFKGSLTLFWTRFHPCGAVRSLPCATSGCEVSGIGRVQRHVSDLLGYLERNRDALVPYAARRRRGGFCCKVSFSSLWASVSPWNPYAHFWTPPFKTELCNRTRMSDPK
jgi:hypothetical protein